MHQHKNKYQVGYRDEVRYNDKEWMYLGRHEVILVLVAAGHQREVDNDREGRVDP